jgi:hypothetical protein
MDEVDKHAEVDEGQAERDRDRDVRDELVAGLARDRCERQHTEHDGGHERAQSELCTEIADEVPQHAGTELR